MSTEILSEGYNDSVFAHSSATTAKTFYLINAMVWLAMNDAAANADNVFVYEAPKVRAPKATGQAWAAGDEIYWDDTNKEFTTTATANTLAGRVVEAAASGDTEGIIHLTPFFLAAA